MKSVGLWLTWTTPGCELRTLDAMNNLCMLTTLTTLGHELRSLDAMDSSMLLMIHTILGHELKDLDAMNNLAFMDDMNDFGSWTQGSRHNE